MTRWLIQALYLWVTVPLDETCPPLPQEPTEPPRVQPMPLGPKAALKGNACELAWMEEGEETILPDDYTPPPELGVTGFYRDRPGAIWRHTSVDRNGQHRPTILYTPEGLYRSSDGQAFPYPRAAELHWNLVSPLK